jgi:LacI family transcriptional regulator
MSRKKNVTIEDIARHANVSISTVSRVLRNSSGVASQKREAVLFAVEELEYQPNIFAQSLASGQSMTIGVITQNFGSPFYDGILLGILQELESTDYSPIFADGRWDLQAEKRALQTFRNRRVDGLILVGGQLSHDFLQKNSKDIPMIFVARQLPTLIGNCIYADNFKAGYEITRFLLDQGHRNIAHITAKMHYEDTVGDIHERFLGYKQALSDAGLSFDPQLVVEGDLLQRSGVLAVEMLLMGKRPFSAIFCANDQMACGARLALHRRGIRVPDDISLVGFDDEETSAYLVPPLTTVRQPAEAMGRAAATAILDLISNKPVKTQVFESQLIVRESVLRRR